MQGARGWPLPSAQFPLAPRFLFLLGPSARSLSLLSVPVTEKRVCLFFLFLFFFRGHARYLALSALDSAAGAPLTTDGSHSLE